MNCSTNLHLEAQITSPLKLRLKKADKKMMSNMIRNTHLSALVIGNVDQSWERWKILLF